MDRKNAWMTYREKDFTAVEELSSLYRRFFGLWENGAGMYFVYDNAGGNVRIPPPGGGNK